MLDINLASRIYIDNRKVSMILLAAAGLAILFLAGNIWLSVLAYQELLQVREAVAGGVNNLSKGARQISEKDYQLLQERIQFANGVLLRKNHDWLAMLDRLEQVVPPGVMLVSVDPDNQQRGLKISGYALDFRKVRTLYETMATGTLFTDVVLLSQSHVKVGEQQQGVTFAMVAKVVQ
jgi:type IV pilus assembly protein PilN